MRMFVLVPLILMSLAASAGQDKAQVGTTGYQSPGKPGAKVALNYRLSKERVAVGETVQVHLSITNNPQEVSARLETSPNLLLTSSPKLIFTTQQDKQNAEGLTQHTVSVTPQTEGIHILTIYAKDQAYAYEKPLAVQIVAGSKPIQDYLTINGRLEQQDNGEKLIIMPAEER